MESVGKGHEPPNGRRVAATLAVMCLMFVSGCSDTGDGPGTSPSSVPTGGAVSDSASDGSCDGVERYVVLDDPAWEFQEAVDYLAGERVVAVAEPSLDWYSEHNRRPSRQDGQVFLVEHLRISGHEAGLDEHRRELPGADLESRDIQGSRALVGAAPGGSPSVVTMAICDRYSVMLLSYDLDADRLVEIVASLRTATEAEWVEAGGRILGCHVTEPGCVDSLVN